MSQMQKEQLKEFRIQESSRYIKIIPLRDRFKTQILIEKRSSKVLLGGTHLEQHLIIDKSVIYKQTEDKTVSVKSAALILGVIFMQSQKFLVYAESVYPQSLLPSNAAVYQLADVRFLSFSEESQGPKGKNKQALQVMQKEIFGFSFYFSFDRDLTLSFQELYGHGGDQARRPRWRYFWNREMLVHMIGEKNMHDTEGDSEAMSEWCIPVVQGHYEAFEYVIKESSYIKVLVVSRRSKHRSGTRFYNRGIDQSGRCANFVATEVAVVQGESLVSVQYYSGSVPLFWQQKSQLAMPKLTRDRELQMLPFKKHLRALIQDAGPVMLINLLEKSRQQESLLIGEYEYLVQAHEKEFEQSVRYAYFDINAAQKNGEHDRIWEFIETILPVTDVFKCFQINLRTGIILSRQRGAFRVSCLDCLARTNRFLQLLSFQALYILLERLQIFNSSFKRLSLDLLLKEDEKLHPFLRYYRMIWHQKGNFESIVYAGSPLAQFKKSKFLSQVQNSIISLQRYYNQKFLDQLKQHALDSILFHKNYEYYQQSQRQVNQQSLAVSILTWNINAADPDKLKDLPTVLRTLSTSSDLIVIGFQEMIELSTNNVMTDNTEESKQSDKWQKFILTFLQAEAESKMGFGYSNKNKKAENNQLNIQASEKDEKSIKEFVLVQKVQMVGLFMMVLISKKWAPALKSVQKDVVKTGLRIGMGEHYGNKGGVVIRVNIFDTSISLICAHLAAHQGKIRERMNDLQDIHRKAFQQNQKSIQNQLQIDFSDYKFFFGDLNFRLEGDFKQIKTLIQDSNDQKSVQPIIDQLLASDQLVAIMKSAEIRGREPEGRLANNSKNQSQSMSSQNGDENQNEGSQNSAGDGINTYLQSQAEADSWAAEQMQDIPQYFKLYQESKIRFFPTYKLDKTTGQYTLEKSRNPSYCDRILFWANDDEGLQIKEHSYSDIKARGSDHRPVIGHFEVTILKETRTGNQSVIIQQEEESGLHSPLIGKNHSARVKTEINSHMGETEDVIEIVDRFRRIETTLEADSNI